MEQNNKIDDDTIYVMNSYMKGGRLINAIQSTDDPLDASFIAHFMLGVQTPKGVQEIPMQQEITGAKNIKDAYAMYDRAIKEAKENFEKKLREHKNKLLIAQAMPSETPQLKLAT